MSRSGPLFVVVWAVFVCGCASTGSIPKPFPTPGGQTPAAPLSAAAEANAAGDAIVGTALALRGTPYRNGGADPAGFDCSGFVEYVFARHGIAVPRTVAQQYRVGTPVDTDDLQPGDLVFFQTVAPGASHVGIAIGGDEFVDAPSGNGVVRVDRLSAPYWAARLLGVRRVVN